MRSLAIAACVAVFAALSSTQAAACSTFLTVDNDSDVSINLLSCATRKQGSDKWIANFNCLDDLLSKARIAPGKGTFWMLDTMRKPKTQFKVRVTYHYGVDGPVRTSESDYSKCRDGHGISVN